MVLVVVYVFRYCLEIYVYLFFISTLSFQVDGLHNHKIQTMKFPRFPIKCAKFFKDGRRFVVGSDLYGHFFVYDMEGGKEIMIPWNKSEDRKCMKVKFYCFCLCLLRVAVMLKFDYKLGVCFSPVWIMSDFFCF